jgi:tetratricopeptide (TPR) repeat protein
LALACGAVLALAACAGVPQQINTPSDDEMAWVLGGAGRLQGAPPAGQIEELAALMRVTPEMHRFAEAALQDRHGTTRRIDALVRALDGPQGLDLQYDSAATLTAAQAFSQRRVNCLSYALLFTALARDAGIQVQFNDVEIPPLWDLGDARTSLLYRHLNLRVEIAAPMYQVVDVSGGDYDPTFPQHVLSDAEAEAQFYNNRAMELMLASRGEEALRHELRALQLAPDAPYLWGNLAGIYLHEHALRAARIAVDRALAMDPSALLPYQTAAEVYAALGQQALAARLHQRAQDFLDDNPYYHYQLALGALDRHDEPAAYEQVHQAIALRPEEPRFLFLQALLLARRGETRLADDDMQAVMELTRSTAQQERYRNKFIRLKEQNRPAAAGKG